MPVVAATAVEAEQVMEVEWVEAWVEDMEDMEVPWVLDTEGRQPETTTAVVLSEWALARIVSHVEWAAETVAAQAMEPCLT